MLLLSSRPLIYPVLISDFLRPTFTEAFDFVLDLSFTTSWILLEAFLTAAVFWISYFFTYFFEVCNLVAGTLDPILTVSELSSVSLYSKGIFPFYLPFTSFFRDLSLSLLVDLIEISPFFLVLSILFLCDFSFDYSIDIFYDCLGVAGK